jgi:hypothetical protein
MSRSRVAFIAKNYALETRCPVGRREVTPGSENVYSRASDGQLNAFRKQRRETKVKFAKTRNVYGYIPGVHDSDAFFNISTPLTLQFYCFVTKSIKGHQIT